MKKIFNVMMLVIAMTMFTVNSFAQAPNNKQRLTREQLSEKQAKYIANDLALDDETTAKFINTYTQCQKEYFPIGIRQETHAETAFLIATPEKALCDLIIHTPNLNLRFKKEILTYLEEFLRFDMDAFYQMDYRIFEQCAEVGKKKVTFKKIVKILKP